MSSPIDIDVSQSGKTCLGIVCYNTGNRYLYPQYFMLTSATNLRAYVYNVSGSAITATMTVVALYV